LADRISLQMLRSVLAPLPAAARHYMTAVIAVGLILMALHFGLQAHVQQQVRQLVGQWLSEAGGEAGEIRYRLLRGVITVKDAQLSRGGMTLHVDRAYLHAPLSTLLSERLSVSRVLLRGLEIELGNEFSRDLFQARAPQHVQDAFDILEMARRIQVDGFNIRILGGQPLEVIGGRILLAQDEKLYRVQLQGFMAGGQMEMSGNWQRDDAGALQVKSAWKWRNVPLEPLFAQQSMQAWLQGASDGELSWQGDWTNGSHEASGRLSLFNPAARGFGEVSAQTSEVGFEAKASHDRWEADVQCAALPLNGAAAYAPVLNGRQLASGSYSGSIQAAGSTEQGNEPAGWRAEIQGELVNVVYRAPNLPSWHLGRIALTTAKIRMPARQLHVEKVLIADSNVVFLLAASGAETNSFSNWQARISHIDVQGLNLGLQPAEAADVMRFPVLQGRGEFRKGGTLAVALNGQEEAGQWRIKAEAVPVQGTLTADVAAKGVPLVRLRPLLPEWPGMQGEPELAGKVDMNIKLYAGPDKLFMRGQVKAVNVSIAQAGTHLSADRVLIDIRRLGLQKRHIAHLQADGWRYQAALLPMAVPGPVPPVDPVSRKAKNWRIDRLALNRGTLSIGSEDEAWLRGIKIRGQGLYAGNNAPVSMQAFLGEAPLSLEGAMDTFAPIPRFNIRASLRHALPFFLGDWFSISGAPRIIRGRLNADFRLESGKPAGQYQGVLYLGLYHGQLADGAFPDDAMLKLTGYSTHTIFERLQTPTRWRLKAPIAGDWQNTPLSPGHIGSQLLASIKSQVEKKASAGGRPPAKEGEPLSVAHVRLHDRKRLTHNERTRLKDMVASFGVDQKPIIELLPQLGNEQLDAVLVRRVRHIQKLIKAYLRKQGIPRSRIFPVWPQEQHRTGTVGGITIRAFSL